MQNLAVVAERIQQTIPEWTEGTDYDLLIPLEGTLMAVPDTDEFPVSAGDAILLHGPVKIKSADSSCRAIRIGFSRETVFHSCLPVLEGCPLLLDFFSDQTSDSSMTYLHFEGLSPAMRELAAQMAEEYSLR